MSDLSAEIRDFLSTRRARITPEQAGLPAYGGHRRVKGLRREEVAMLAGVSVDYYVRLERGGLAGASEAVLEALARALQLDDAERGHLVDLAATANASSATRARSHRPRPTQVRPGLVRTVEAITEAPAFITNGRRDVVAANRLGRALYSELYSACRTSGTPVNTARFTFLDPRAQRFFLDWERVANDVVANLRTDAGRNPYDRALTDLVGELATRSEDFRVRWASHDVRYHHTGTKGLHHPVVGDLVLSFEVMTLPADPGLALVVYSAEEGSVAADGLRLLASWAATEEAERLLSAEVSAAASPDTSTRVASTQQVPPAPPS